MWMQFGGIAMLTLLLAAVVIVIVKEMGWKGFLYLMIAMAIMFSFAGLVVTAVGMINFGDFATIWTS